MKIVVDDKIPYIREALSQMADEVVCLAGTRISAADVRDADALVVRTRTRCDEALLSGSRVSFVATATIGFDHIDADYLSRAGIEWMSCPGCNAASVAQYVRSVLLLLRRDRGRRLEDMTLGVVGCGHVGSRVARAALGCGMRVMLCDPPRVLAGDTAAIEPRCVAVRAADGGSSAVPVPEFVGMDVIERECDVITFHVPLVKDGSFSTYHIADGAFFSRVSRRPVLINTSRGGVVDNAALKAAIIRGRVAETVIDTWENEPQIDLELLSRVWIGTPHVAGYSADGKTNADNMVIEGLCRHFGIVNRWHIEPPALPPDFVPSADPDTLRLQLYNPMDDCLRLRRHPEQFEQQRGDYPLRREHAPLIPN